MLDAPGATSPADLRADRLSRIPVTAIGAALVAIAFLVYWLPGYDRIYNHFVLLAIAFLHGRAEIPAPAFQDVWPILGPNGQPTGEGLLPFPPLPAVVLMPFVALWGIATNERLVSTVLGAIDVGIAWWALGRVAVSRPIRLATTIFFAFGTVFWYAAQIGSTWFFAHVVAVTFALLAVGVALAADPGADDEVDAAPSAGELTRSARAALRSLRGLLDGRQVAAGLLFGLACTARLTVVFGAPFFVFVGGGGGWIRRSLSAGLGAAIPVGLLVAYNLATTGHVFNPGYDYLYGLEASGYPGLHYNPSWAIEDIRYLPQNLQIMFLSTPALFPQHMTIAGGTGAALCVDPGATRSLFDPDCPLALPSDVGMSLLLTSPAYLLAVPALIAGRSRLVAGAFLAIVAIAIVNLMHFSQGWVQFGYRFSNDFVAFALPLVAVGMSRLGKVGFLALGLIGVSIAVNIWGVTWGNLLGW